MTLVSTMPSTTVNKKSWWDRVLNWLDNDSFTKSADDQMQVMLDDMISKNKLFGKETHTVLVFSTSHITPETDSILSDLSFVSGDVPGINTHVLFSISATDFGHIIQISLDDDFLISIKELQDIDLEDLYPILKLAYETQCAYIHLDADGPIYPEFTTYTW